MPFNYETWPPEYDGTPKTPSAGELWWTAITMVVDNSVKLVPALLLPALLILAFESFQEIYAGPDSSQGPLTFVIIAILEALVISFFAITCFRVFLLGRDSVPWFGELRCPERVIRFMGCFLFMTIAGGLIPFVVVCALVALLPRLGWAFPLTPVSVSVHLILSAYISFRFMLLLPATAVDMHLGFRDVWKVSRGKVGRMFVALILVPLVALLPYLLVHETPQESESAIREMALSAIRLGIFPFFLAVVSLLFKEIFGYQVNGGEPLPQTDEPSNYSPS